MRTDPKYTSVCIACWRQTWYTPDEPDRWAYGNRAHEHGVPGAVNLKVIDTSSLAPQFERYYLNEERVRVRFAYGEELTGTIGRTGGWRPCYLLMRRSSDIGSTYTLGASDTIVAVKRGREYRPIR